MLRAILCVVFLTSLLQAATLPEPRFTDPDRLKKMEKAYPEVEKIFAKYMADRRIPGMVYGLVVDGKLVHVKSMGVRDQDKKDAVNADTVFRIASMTKSFTSLAMLKLRDEGKLSLEDPVSKWIPEFARMELPTKDSAPLRVRDLLTHSAGFPEDNPWGDRQLAIADAELTKWLEQGIPFSTAPGTEYEYSNYGFALAGRVITKAAGMPYSKYLTEQILKPLGMTSSTLEPKEVAAERRATGYRLIDGAYVEDKPLADGAFGPMGGLLVSANDLARYIAFQLDAWPARDAEESGPVRRSSRREMQKVWRTSGLNVTRASVEVPLRVSSVGYGYGLGVSRDCNFEHMVGHGGGLPGFGSYMLWLPEYGVGMFAMTNYTYAGPSAPIAESLVSLKATGGLERRKLPAAPVLTETRDAIVKLWREWDNADAERLAADNFFLDSSAATRKRNIEQLKKDLGECENPSEVEPENWLRGRFRMKCKKGSVNVIFTLAPTQPPKLQALGFSPNLDPTEVARKAASAMATLDGGKAREVAESGLQGKLASTLEAARVTYGSCSLGDPVMGDGSTFVVMKLNCSRAPAEMRLQLTREGKVREVAITKPAGEACVP
jgi:CubicO group peptidase (beta-lactamase class C family)